MKRILVFAATSAALAAVYAIGQLQAQVQLGTPAAVKSPTRFALVNIETVLQGYEKAKVYKREMDRLLEPPRKQAEEIKKHVLRVETDLGKSDLTPEKRKELEQSKRKLQRRLEDLQQEFNKMLREHSERQIVQIYKEVTEAVKAHAKKHGLQAVFCHGESSHLDPLGVENIVRKIRGVESSGCVMAMYFEPELDISAAVTEALNRSYKEVPTPQAKPVQ
jgi:Skp family chaperone for outer membrane proteins